MKKEILIRSLSGAVYVALILTALLLLNKGYSLPFFCLFGVLAILGVAEAERMLVPTGQPRFLGLLDMLGSLVVFVSVAFIGADPLLIMPALAFFVVRAVAQLYAPQADALRNLSGSIFAVAYVAVPLGLMPVLHTMTWSLTLLAVLILIWLNDTGAFLVGSSIGKHRLFERISPKKSWEGFVGGLLTCVIAAVIAWHYGIRLLEGFGLLHWILLAVVVSVFATLGDLLESLLKRTAGVKDSGNVIPGHGGVLDRIDSLLLVSPAVFVFFVLLSWL